MLKGFREFLMRGNIVELAVAVIMGVAFNGVVDAVIKGVVDPLIAQLAPGQMKDLENALLLGPFKLGLLISAIINFLTKAAVVYFLIVRPFSRLAARWAPPAPATPADVVLLTEIRDILKQRPVA